jgi:hypothetical protein
MPPGHDASMIAPLDANVLARPVRLGDELALRYSNGVDTVEISRAAYAAYTAFAAYTVAHGFSADGLPVRLPALRLAPGTRLPA